MKRRKRRRLLTRLSVGDLVTVVQGDWYPDDSDEDIRGKVRLWSLTETMYDFIAKGTPAILVAIDRPVVEFTPPSDDSHWITLLIGDKLYEAISDEAARVEEKIESQT